MPNNKDSILSNTVSIAVMITESNSLKLITTTGNIINLSEDSDYDLLQISSYLSEKLTGKNYVDICLNTFKTKQTNILDNNKYSSNGIKVLKTINGVDVEGMFYPIKEDDIVLVETKDGTVTVPNTENLARQVKLSKEKNDLSVINFFKRLATVIKDRKHSAEDLMNFIKLCNLPLTNEGRVICYKRVTSYKDHKDTFVDSYTKKIKQSVGTRVTMPIKKVNSNRNLGCAEGLHVANLSYLSSYIGDVILVVLVSPEDFISVPIHDIRKARVSSYDIVGKLDPESFNLVSKGYSANEIESHKKLIKDITLGRTVRITKLVKVGKTVIYENISKNFKIKKTNTLSNKDYAQNLFKNKFYKELAEFVKSKKKSYNYYGFKSKEVSLIHKNTFKKKK